MAARFAVLEYPDTLHLPEEAQAALRLHPGSRIAITIEEGRVVLQTAEEEARPTSETDRAELLAEQKERDARARVEEIGNNLRSLFAGQPSLEDEYFRTRDRDKW